MKKCTKCEIEKPLTEFCRHSAAKDGLRSRCRACHSEEVRAWSAANRERRNRTNREWRKAKVGHVVGKLREWRESNPDKKRAYMAVSNAIRTGTLVKQPCVACGSDDSQAHHEDYSRPLDVIWLCPVHHRAVHLNQPGALAAWLAKEGR